MKKKQFLQFIALCGQNSEIVDAHLIQFGCKKGIDGFIDNPKRHYYYTTLSDLMETDKKYFERFFDDKIKTEDVFEELVDEKVWRSIGLPLVSLKEKLSSIRGRLPYIDHINFLEEIDLEKLDFLREYYPSHVEFCSSCYIAYHLTINEDLIVLRITRTGFIILDTLRNDLSRAFIPGSFEEFESIVDKFYDLCHY